MATVEVLCVADIHIGRRPSRLPDRFDPADYSPRTIWADLAESAVTQGVDAVVVAGDLVDRENRYAEAFGAVESVATALAEAGIPLVAVAGNHDADVLPDLAEAIDNLQLLGRNGYWERTALTDANGEPSLHVDGWSFPSRYHHESPLATYDLTDEGVPRLGVVHADVSSEDRYAPVAVDDLATSGHAAWILGHLHVPGPRNENPLILYPGSLQPLDTNETGGHGAWLVSVETDGTVEKEPLRSATLQYEEVVVSMDPDSGFHDIVDATHEQLHETATKCSPRTELLAVTVTISGRTDAHTDLRSRRRELEQVELTDGGTTVRVTDVTVDTKPSINLADRAGDDDPIGYLAGLLRALDGDEPLDPYRCVIEAAHTSVRETHDSNAYRELKSHDESYTRPTEAETKEVLRRQARKLVDAFVEQQGVPADE
ncbi:metallophosphoesterase family protein [Halocatena pleomorpha]|uniref:DNA repair exonuclease n=1 Tax=Halocatena pleomorpha TaxID=1785090 RepID=A0A3P3RI25_9EURY|nr:DNA repair exonuclease [Halocatena pleomorpha]RRJ32519.1 DNA repair exonuclease [Halocatena pleomorpha]